MSFGWRFIVVGSCIATAVCANVIEDRRPDPGVAETWKDWTCPPPSTVSLSFTQFVPVTTTQIQTSIISIYETATISVFETATTSIHDTVTTSIYETDTTSIYKTDISYETITQPTTIYQTIISTEIITTVERTTETETVTRPTTTSIPITLTATELERLFIVTSKATSLVICPTRIANPTFTLAAPFPTDWTWGCPPGWLCKLKQEGCNFEAGLPDGGFYCAPNECVPAEILPAMLSTWDDTIYGNSTPATNPALSVNAIDSFFNMNPTDFGLTYQIFIVNEVFVYTTTILLPPSPTVGVRQAQTSIPSACYQWCNNCLLEAQSAGKSPKLCLPGSAFEVSLTQCEQCINVHKTDNSAGFVQIAPQFQQYLDYCAQYSTAVVSTVVTQTTTSGQSTLTTVKATTAVTIVPSSIASSYSILLSTTITGTSVQTATITPSPTPISPSSVSSSSSVRSSAASPPSSSSTISTSVAATTRASSSSASQHLYTTTSAILTTFTAPATTYSGTEVTSITIIISSNGTATTMSGSELSTYTVVIPSSTHVSTSEATVIMTSSGAATSSPPPAVPASPSAASSASTSAFSGGGTAYLIPSLAAQTILSMLLGWVVILI